MDQDAACDVSAQGPSGSGKVRRRAERSTPPSCACAPGALPPAGRLVSINCVQRFLALCMRMRMQRSLALRMRIRWSIALRMHMRMQRFLTLHMRMRLEPPASHAAACGVDAGGVLHPCALRHCLPPPKLLLASRMCVHTALLDLLAGCKVVVVVPAPESRSTVSDTPS